ncbi:MAG TPA: MraY family glycosyltransferase [Candidatus Acidoferrum sp.]|nr:MraY family glycosyltransferase [Candidatus Acidoferrum sp.]
MATPLVGGLAIMVPLLMWIGAVLLSGHAGDLRFEQAIFLCGAGATLVGFADDQSSISPSSRILLLFVLTTIALVIAPQLLPATINWSNLAPYVLAPRMAYGLIALAMVGFVNAVNMADGQDGIVTGMFVIWAACLTMVSGQVSQNIAQVLLVGSIIVFLYNIAGRVFLGDAGTYGVTFVFGILAIQAHNSGAVSAETIAVWFFIPIMDCLRLMVTRVRKGAIPSDGDRNHFHHRLQDLVGKTYGLVIYLGAVGSSSLVTALVPRLSLLCLLLLGAFYFGLILLDPEPGFETAAPATADIDREARDS